MRWLIHPGKTVLSISPPQVPLMVWEIPPLPLRSRGINWTRLNMGRGRKENGVANGMLKIWERSLKHYEDCADGGRRAIQYPSVGVKLFGGDGKTIYQSRHPSASTSGSFSKLTERIGVEIFYYAWLVLLCPFFPLSFLRSPFSLKSLKFISPIDSTPLSVSQA